MASSLPLILALSLSAEPAHQPSPAAVMLTASLGFALGGLGVGFEISGRARPAESNPRAEANTVGGVALISMGLCLFLIAAALSEWRFAPKGPLVLGVQWP